MSPPTEDPDLRYARGELSRDEWARLRQSPASARAPPRPPARPPGLVLAVAVIAVGLVVAGAFLWSMANSPRASWNVTWNPSFGSPWTEPASALPSLNASATQGTAFASNDTLWFRGSTVTLVAYLSPEAHDMAFVVQGLVNPTIHIPAGARVTVTAVNMDSGEYHNWALSRTGPPYSSMPMMGSGSMMSMTMLPPASAGGYPSLSMAFTSQAGTYWYLCEVAGHASSGMYGGFVVG